MLSVTYVILQLYSYNGIDEIFKKPHVLLIQDVHECYCGWKVANKQRASSSHNTQEEMQNTYEKCGDNRV